jgi:hypothetical protein
MSLRILVVDDESRCRDAVSPFLKSPVRAYRRTWWQDTSKLKFAGRRVHVRVESIATETRRPRDVRYSPDSDHVA